MIQILTFDDKDLACSLMKVILNSLSSFSISTVRLLAATMSLYSGSASTGPDTEDSGTIC